MTMQHLENELRRAGDPRKQAFADVIAGIHKSLGSDIPLSFVATPEKQLEIKRFSNEQKEALKKEGYLNYALTGESVKSLRDSGHKFWSDWHKSLPDFEALGSMHSEVAINPNKPFLPKSNNKTLTQQEEMVNKFSEELGKKVKGVKAIIGQVPDYVELEFAHLDSTKEYLFGAKDNYDYTRTKTPTSSSRVAVVGYFNADSGLYVSHWNRVGSYGGVHAAPLVVAV